MAANAESGVSTGALRRIFNNEAVDEPVFQCLQIKQLASRASNDTERYRTVFSDITNFIQSMLGTNLNTLVQQEKLKKGSFVRIKQFQTNEVKGKKIMVILDCEVVEELGEREKIGTPVALEEGGAKEDGGVKTEDIQQQPGAIPSNNFYGNKPQPQAQAQRSLPTRNGPKSSSHGNIYPIEAISPYAHNWTIKARCTSKSDIKTWHKATGEGKLFSVNFLDESGEIRATGFNNECDQLYNIFQEGSVYYISFPCQVKLANKRFSNLTNDYELTFERDTVVEKAEGDEDGVPRVKYNFTTLADLQNVEKDSTIDTIAILKEVGETSQITSKTTSKPYDKRELTLVDNSGYTTRLTIWGASATTFTVQADSVVAFKGVKVSDFNGRSLSLLSSGSMTADPDFDEAHRLKGWYDAQGRSDTFASHASVLGSTGGGGRTDQYKTVAAVKDENIGMSETAEYFTLKATVVYIKSDGAFAYPACRAENCNKKVVEENPGEWRCERHDQKFDRPEWRYILSANVADWTGSIWITCFDEVGRQLFGMTANEMVELRDNDDGKYKEKVSAANCLTRVFRMKASMETFQEAQRVRYTVMSAAAVNFSAESKRLADMLKQYSIQDNGMFVQ